MVVRYGISVIEVKSKTSPVRSVASKLESGVLTPKSAVSGTSMDKETYELYVQRKSEWEKKVI